MVQEVAKVLSCADQHVLDLIDEGRLLGINIGGGERKHWRVPVESFQRFIQENNSLTLPVPRPGRPRAH